jgi:hypothetical protein
MTHTGTHRATGRGRYKRTEPRHARQANTRPSFPPREFGTEDYREGESQASMLTVGKRLVGHMIGDDERAIWNSLRGAVGPESRIGRFARTAMNNSSELLSRHAQRVKNAGVWVGGGAALLALKPVVGADLRSPFHGAIELMSGASEQAPGVVGLGATAVALALTGHLASRATEARDPALEVPNGLNLISGAGPQNPTTAMQPISTAI